MLWAVHRHWDAAPVQFHTSAPDTALADTLAALFADGLVTPGTAG